jgi:hypothetical protein
VIAHRQSKAQPSIQQLQPVFKAVLSKDVIRDLLKTSKRRFYERLLTPMVVTWCLVFQRLNYDHSCDAVVSYVASGAIDDLDDRHSQTISQRIKSQSTSGFCQARARLPLEVLQAFMRYTGQRVPEYLGEKARWLGHLVVLLDGSTMVLRPETELVKHYGQHDNQRGTCYWVVMRIAAAFCLHTGALLDVEEGTLHESEQSLTKDILRQLPPDSVCIGDSNFGVFSVAQAARHYGQLALLRLTLKRARALAKCNMQPGADIAVQWQPSKIDKLDPNMSEAPIAGRVLYVRLERDGFRPVDLYFFTTLLDTAIYTATELVELYGRRWNVELNLRYVKTTLDMNMLAAKSVDVVRKELCAGMIAYNLIRTFMTLAAQGAGLSPLTLSFTKCWRRIRDMLASLRPTATRQYFTEQIQQLLIRLAQCKLTERPRFRIEPRAMRKRRDAYPFLKGSRAEARQRVIEKLQCATKT